MGSSLMNNELAMEAISLFIDETQVTSLQPTTGGVNNFVQYVNLSSGNRLILRIYNNGFDTPKVVFEHQLLRHLNDQQKFSFQLPKFLPSKEGSTMARLSNGSEACMCDWIHGTLPKLTCVREIGRASGELSAALSNKVYGLDETITGNVAPYWKIWDVHHAVTKQSVHRFLLESVELNDVRDVALRMWSETLAIADKCQVYQSSLPSQLIHGDLHYDNVLVEDGKVTAILDFEFAAFDWRAMELAICLSKYAGEEPAMPYFHEFINGFAESGVLTRAEAQAIPDLITLRILSNVVYFVGRAIAGEDNISTLTTRIENYEKRINWLKENANAIVAHIIGKMGL